MTSDYDRGKRDGLEEAAKAMDDMYPDRDPSLNPIRALIKPETPPHRAPIGGIDVKCPRCTRIGIVHVEAGEGLHVAFVPVETQPTTTVCATCHGAGVFEPGDCQTCGGSGVVHDAHVAFECKGCGGKGTR